jgi:alcohol dehydrogenase (cytochrome c)
VWEIPKIGGSVTGGGVMSTAGGLVFYGDNTGGALVAVDAKTGARLWHFDTGEVWKSSPMTYAINGEQYIGVVAGSNVMVFGLP